MIPYALFFIACIYGFISQLHADVVVSIKPLYGLVAKVIGDTDHTIDLLYDGTNSPHTTGLKIDGAAKIKKAELIFWIGSIYESALGKHLTHSEKAIDLSKTKDLALLSYRQFCESSHTSCDHDHEKNDHHSHHTIDGHYWLNVDNAIIMLKGISKALSETFPNDRDHFEKNTEKAIQDLQNFGDTLRNKINAQKKVIKYVTFHDFTQYLDQYFGMQCVGTLVTDSHLGASVKHLSKLFDTIKEGDIDLILIEKQFRQDGLQTLAHDDIPIKTIDYLGTELNPSPFIYERILEELIEGFTQY